MSEPATFDPAFVEAMKRVEAKRLMPEKKKLLRRSALAQPGMADLNGYFYSFLGWVHTNGALRVPPKHEAHR